MQNLKTRDSPKTDIENTCACFLLIISSDIWLKFYFILVYQIIWFAALLLKSLCDLMKGYLTNIIYYKLYSI